jgi:SAM-dependent methyltransferase
MAGARQRGRAPSTLDEPPGLSNPRAGIREIAAAAGPPGAVLDVGCGSGRLTVALAAAGHTVTGIDVNDRQLTVGRQRAADAGAGVRFLHADMNQPLPFADGAFTAAVSRLSLMIAADPPATLREVARTVRAGGRIVTGIWASAEENVWFLAPRAAVAEALGAERAAFARHFGRLGTTHELEDVHRRAGLEVVEVQELRDHVSAASVADHWDFLTQTIGHYTRLAESLTVDEADRLEAALSRALEPFRTTDGLQLPRCMLMAVGQR